jgi:predicted nucleic acid-binding protein
VKAVLDASIAIKWVLPETDSIKAVSLRDEFRNNVRHFIAPDTFPVEVAHALTRAERRGLIQQNEARIKLSDVFTTAPDLHPYLPLLPRAVELSSQVRLGVYDCLYVALAEQEQCELLSADVRMVSHFRGQFQVTLLANLP